MATPELPATAFVVLGLVSVRPTTGHDLNAFAERSIGQFFPLTRSHVYTELDRLCRLGLLEATDVAHERFTVKRVYAITEEGSQVFEDWLERGELPAERHRSPFLVRLFFGDRLPADRLAELLDAYGRAARQRRDRLSDIVEHLADRPQSVFRRATAMYGLAQAEATLNWLEQIRPLLLGAGTTDAPRC